MIERRRPKALETTEELLVILILSKPYILALVTSRLLKSITIIHINVRHFLFLS